MVTHCYGAERGDEMDGWKVLCNLQAIETDPELLMSMSWCNKVSTLSTLDIY